MLTDLLDYRRHVASIYANVRNNQHPPESRWQTFKQQRDQLFKHHPASALSPQQKHAFTQLEYFAYEPALRFELALDTHVEPEVFDVMLRDDGAFKMQRVAALHFEVGGTRVRLSLFKILGYAGGLFLPFRDATNTEATYGGGRYLLDTMKHADLGSADGQPERLVIDFNFAYNPSCAYNDDWHCPLSPPENRLAVAITAGEKRFHD